jgi:hypothetical protein
MREGQSYLNQQEIRALMSSALHKIQTMEVAKLLLVPLLFIPDPPRNRLSPRYINIATKIQQACWDRSTTRPKQKTQRKIRETNADYG